MKLPFIKTSISILNLWLWDFGFAKMENTGCLPSVMNTKVEHTGAARKDPPGLRRHTCSKFWRNPSGDSMSMPIRISIAIARLPSFQGWIWKLFSLHLYCLEKRKSYIYMYISYICTLLIWYADMNIPVYKYMFISSFSQVRCLFQHRWTHRGPIFKLSPTKSLGGKIDPQLVPYYNGVFWKGALFKVQTFSH